MQTSASLKLDYGNWVSKKFMLVPGILCLAFIGLAFLAPGWAVLAGLFGIVCAYFVYSYMRFSPAGGDVQARIVGLILDRLEWDGNGKALDIGCGNGALTLRLAQKYPAARVTGIDFGARIGTIPNRSASKMPAVPGWRSGLFSKKPAPRPCRSRWVF